MNPEQPAKDAIVGTIVLVETHPQGTFERGTVRAIVGAEGFGRRLAALVDVPFTERDPANFESDGTPKLVYLREHYAQCRVVVDPTPEQIVAAADDPFGPYPTSRPMTDDEMLASYARGREKCWIEFEFEDRGVHEGPRIGLFDTFRFP